MDTPKTINIEKYAHALNNLVGMDIGYLGDSDENVNAIVEVIVAAKKLENRVKEFAEENEKLRAENDDLKIYNKDYKYRNKELCAANEEWKEECAELREENDRLRDLISEVQSYNEAWVEDNGKLRKEIKTLKADAIQKMQTMIKEKCIAGGIWPAFVAKVVEDVGQKLLEENE